MDNYIEVISLSAPMWYVRQYNYLPNYTMQSYQTITATVKSNIYVCAKRRGEELLL